MVTLIDRRTSMAPHHPRQAGVLPGARWGSVAVEHLGAVGVPGGGRPVRVQDQGPAPLVDDDLVVVETLCRPRDYADLAVKPLVAVVNGLGRSA
jgi:hypothetical protein